jgi:hypothetical protein
MTINEKAMFRILNTKLYSIDCCTSNRNLVNAATGESKHQNYFTDSPVCRSPRTNISYHKRP